MALKDTGGHDKKTEQNKITKITTFVNHKPREHIVKHKQILDDLKLQKKKSEQKEAKALEA